MLWMYAMMFQLMEGANAEMLLHHTPAQQREKHEVTKSLSVMVDSLEV